MFKPLKFSRDMEELVGFVEDTAPEGIVEGTLARLRQGAPVKTMLAAADLAVTRSTELPSHHHGGPIHPVCGTYPVYHTSQLLSGEQALLPIIQHVALCNRHIHSPEMGPHIMAETGPMSGGNGTAQATRDAFLMAVQRRYPAAAEKYLLWLLEQVPHGEVLDAVVTKAVPRNPEDDHFFLFPMFTARALDCVGWEWAPVLMRQPVRFMCRTPYFSQVLGQAPPMGPLEALIDEYRLLDAHISFYTTSGETEAIGELAGRIGETNKYAEVPVMLAQALARGMSLEGVGEALSIGAATIFLRTAYGNPMDVHLHTGINVRRYLLKQEGVGLRNKILALLTWHSGPEVRLSENKMVWPSKTDQETLAKLPKRSQAALLDAIAGSVEAQPPVDWSKIGTRLDLMVAAPEVRETIALGQQYADLGYDPIALFTRLAEMACRDDYTEMHVFKHLQAVVEEFYTTREPFRSVHLVAAAKAAAVIHGKQQAVYQQARELIKA